MWYKTGAVPITMCSHAVRLLDASSVLLFETSTLRTFRAQFPM